MRKVSLITVLLLVMCFQLWADFEETYATWTENFGLDPNAGRSSFLVLIIPAGGRYQSMASAYTAMTKDLGFIDANPAVSSYLNNSEFMVFHNDWILDSNLESIAYTQRFGDLGVGVAAKMLWLPFEETNSWGEAVAEGAYTESVMTLNGSYNFLNNYYYDGLSVGLNIKTAYRGISQTLAEDQNALALMGDLGLITRFNLLKFFASRERNFALGLTVKNLGTEFIDDPDPLPSGITAGIAYSPLRPLTIASDVTYPFYINGESAEQISYAFGMDVTALSFLSVQAGFLLKAGKPRLTMGSMVTVRNYTLYANYTLDLTTQFRPVDRMSLSLKIDLGDGGRMTIRDKVQEIYLQGLESYANGYYLEAISYWEECLELDEEFTPALEMIETTQKSIELEDEMRDLQQVE